MHTSAIALEARGQEMVPANESGSDYWDAFISEGPAADFLELTPRTMQKWRQVGGGPEYFVISERCIRYTRRLLKRWADARLRRSTSDPGVEIA